MNTPSHLTNDEKLAWDFGNDDQRECLRRLSNERKRLAGAIEALRRALHPESAADVMAAQAVLNKLERK